MSKRMIAAYIYLAACIICAIAAVVFVLMDDRRSAAWLLVVAIPLWVGGLIWRARL